MDRFEQRASDSHHDCARDLVVQAAWVYDGAAFKGLGHTRDTDNAVTANFQFDAGGNITSLLRSTGDAEPPRRGTLLATPAESLGGRL